MAQEKFGLGAAAEYWPDAWQRSVLFLERLNERGNTSLAQAAKEAPHVLTFKAELVRDGRTAGAPGQLRAGAHRSAAGRDRSIRPSRRSSSSIRAPATVPASAA